MVQRHVYNNALLLIMEIILLFNANHVFMDAIFVLIHRNAYSATQSCFKWALKICPAYVLAVLICIKETVLPLLVHCRTSQIP